MHRNGPELYSKSRCLDRLQEPFEVHSRNTDRERLQKADKMSSSTETLDTIKTVNILGVNVAAVNMPRLVQAVTDAADLNTGGDYCATNVYTTVLAYENDAYQSILNNSALT